MVRGDVVPGQGEGGGLDSDHDALGGDGVLAAAVKGRQVGHGVVPSTLIWCFSHCDLSLLA